MSDESIKSSSTSDNSFTPSLSYIGTKTRVKFVGSSLKQDKILFPHKNIVNIYIVYEINLWNYVDSSNPTLGYPLCAAVKLVKNGGIDKYKYSGYEIGFDMKGTFSFPTGGFGKHGNNFWSRYEFFCTC